MSWTDDKPLFLYKQQKRRKTQPGGLAPTPVVRRLHKQREYREQPKPPLKAQHAALLALLTDKPQRPSVLEAVHDGNVGSGLRALQARGLAWRMTDGSGWVKA